MTHTRICTCGCNYSAHAVIVSEDGRITGRRHCLKCDCPKYKHSHYVDSSDPGITWKTAEELDAKKRRGMIPKRGTGWKVPSGEIKTGRRLRIIRVKCPQCLEFMGCITDGDSINTEMGHGCTNCGRTVFFEK